MGEEPLQGFARLTLEAGHRTAVGDDIVTHTVLSKNEDGGAAMVYSTSNPMMRMLSKRRERSLIHHVMSATRRSGCQGTFPIWLQASDTILAREYKYESRGSIDSQLARGETSLQTDSSSVSVRGSTSSSTHPRRAWYSLDTNAAAPSID